jgi:hypothetical protein
MVLVKGHDFLVTRPSGSSEHVVATRAVPLLDLRTSGQHPDLYVRRKAQLGRANRAARRLPEQVSIVARSPPSQQRAQEQDEAQQPNRRTLACLWTVFDLIRHIVLPWEGFVDLALR